MAAANDAQVQQFVNERIRPRCEQIRGLLNSLTDDIAAIDDVYAALTAQSPTWTDQRTDAPPHLLTGSDVLAINSILNDLKTAINGNAQLPIVRKACVRAVG